MLTPGFHPVPDGMIAAVVTHLQQPVPSDAATPDMPAGTTLRRVPAPDVDWYREVYTRIGALDWLWFSRLKMPAETLRQTLHDPRVEVFAVAIDGKDEGLLEMDFRPDDGTCELAFLGLTKAAQGRGLGPALIRHGLARAAHHDVPVMTIHTCTLDSPWALQFYMRNGFTPVRREVEIVADPRLDGTLPEAAAPQHPIIPA